MAAKGTNLLAVGAGFNLNLKLDPLVPTTASQPRHLDETAAALRTTSHKPRKP